MVIYIDKDGRNLLGFQETEFTDKDILDENNNINNSAAADLFEYAAEMLSVEQMEPLLGENEVLQFFEIRDTDTGLLVPATITVYYAGTTEIVYRVNASSGFAYAILEKNVEYKLMAAIYRTVRTETLSSFYAEHKNVLVFNVDTTVFENGICIKLPDITEEYTFIDEDVIEHLIYNAFGTRRHVGYEDAEHTIAYSDMKKFIELNPIQNIMNFSNNTTQLDMGFALIGAIRLWDYEIVCAILYGEDYDYNDLCVVAFVDNDINKTVYAIYPDTGEIVEAEKNIFRTVNWYMTS